MEANHRELEIGFYMSFNKRLNSYAHNAIVVLSFIV
jgi:hypothetical protein